MKLERGERFAGRYRIEGPLGRGGMGAVYRAADESSGRQLALKLLLVDAADPMARRAAVLFEREYHALEQLAHPRIIAAYDYGVVAGVPYYTMELLDGDDLRELAPMPWPKVLGLLREVCSALALLHSRRMVHRDLSPRNVRLLADGHAKLIDFGAMSPMGSTNQVAGTPAYIAPEVMSGSDVDGRADLFSLGALTYWALTGRHAFPAKKMVELESVWRAPPPPPSTFAPDIPRGVDDLVMTMMSMDPLERPQTAAEVADRMSALAGLEPVEWDSAALAYLRTPTLVGREDHRARFMRRVRRAQRGLGGTLHLEGRPGMGRSRLLGALLVDAKLVGALTVRVNAGELRQRPLALWRALALALLREAPDDARAASRGSGPALAGVLPELFGLPAAATDAALDASSETVQVALVEWLLRLCDRRCLVLGLDDVERCDDASLAALARLVHQSAHRQLLCVTTAALVDGQPQSRAVDRLAAAGSHITLGHLDAEDSRALIASIFGAVPNLDVVASWIYGIAHGTPVTTMELAQFLVDRGVARFSEGAWALPEQLRDQALPGSLEQAVETRLAALSSAAQALAGLLALVTPHGPLDLDDYLDLLAHRFEPSAVFAALDELVAGQMVLRQGQNYALRGQALFEAVVRAADPELQRDLHRRLAARYADREGCWLLHIYHTAHGGQWVEALEALIAVGRDALITDVAAPDAVFARSRYGTELMEAAIVEAERRGYPPLLAAGLRRSLIGVAASARPERVSHAVPLLAELRRASGLDHFDSTDPALPVLERVVACLQRAQASYAATDPARRGYDPVQALREIALVTALLTGIYVRVLNGPRLLALPDLVSPLAPLAPSAALLERLTRVTSTSIVVGADVADERMAMRRELSQPLDGVDDVLRQGIYQIHSFYCGVELATRGDSRALELADELPAVGTHAALPWQVRKLYFQHHGDHQRMDQCRQRMEALSVGHVEAEGHLTVSLIFELGIAAMCADLVEVKRLRRFFEREAAEYAGWKPLAHLAGALYGLLRQDLSSAERQARKGLERIEPLQHVAWLPLRTCLVDVLRRTDRCAEALRLASESRVLFERRGLTIPLGVFPSIEVPMAFAEAALGLEDQASARLDALVARVDRCAASWVPRGVAHEERARLCLMLGDAAGFEQHAARAAEVYRAGKMPSLARRYAMLMTDARQLDHSSPSGLSGVLSGPQDSSLSDLETSVVTLLRSCRGPEERAERALELLLQHAGAAGGYLFGRGPKGPYLMAPRDAEIGEAKLTERVRGFLASLSGRATLRASRKPALELPAGPGGWTLGDGRLYFPFALGAGTKPRGGASAVVLLPAASNATAPRVSPGLLRAIGEALLHAGDVVAAPR